ncbi:urea transporter [Pendulispora rubella]|uniref:Urea transporter n=1 Tax=Pendulispora rubella TaxID=2741070 RepID=A0ABZ2L6B3_9BACT
MTTKDMAKSFARIYAHILFSRSPVVGLLVVLATMVSPRAFVFGGIAACAANGFALLFDLEKDAVEDGSYGYNALLVGLGIGQSFEATDPAWLITVIAAAACVLFTSALRSLLGGLANLPSLSIPFLLVFYFILNSAGFIGLAPAVHAADAGDSVMAQFARSLGGLFFLPRLDAGLLILLALLIHSRVAALLAVLSFGMVYVLHGAMPWLGGVAMSVLGYNAVLTAMALGGVFFVPSPSSFGLALLGAAVSALVAVGLIAPLARLGVPALILPFNVTLLGFLLAMRRRTHDASPKSVDFLPGTPEQNLAYVRTRLERFDSLHPISFRLPYRGTWVCTQGVDGAFTHKGPWRHAFDFQVVDDEGRFHAGAGTAPEDFHCHRLPVLAVAEGTVVSAESNIVDNGIGEVNLERNWGNHVLVHHGPGLYSLVGHLARGSVKVVVGQWVMRGQVVGLAGNSGRSPEPHLHFQLQAKPELGAPTLPCRFDDVVTVAGDGLRLERTLLPSEGTAARNLEPDEEMPAYLGLSHGACWSFRTRGDVEEVVCDADVYGRLRIQSKDREATLFYGKGADDFFTAFDAVGDAHSVVHLLRAALPRVPLECNASLLWTDRLPAQRWRSLPVRILADFVAPFLRRDGIEMLYRMHREGRDWIIAGESQRRDRHGVPRLRTRVRLARGEGPVAIELTVRGVTRRAERVSPNDACVLSPYEEPLLKKETSS